MDGNREPMLTHREACDYALANARQFERGAITLAQWGRNVDVMLAARFPDEPCPRLGPHGTYHELRLARRKYTPTGTRSPGEPSPRARGSRFGDEPAGH